MTRPSRRMCAFEGWNASHWGEEAVGVDQVAAIRPIVAELEEVARDPVLLEYCGKFEIPGRQELWVELILGSVNCAYPYGDDPLARVQGLGLEHLPGLMMSEWEPGKFATFDYDRVATRREVARFIDGWFSKILACGDDYLLDVGISPLA